MRIARFLTFLSAHFSDPARTLSAHFLTHFQHTVRTRVPTGHSGNISRQIIPAVLSGGTFRKYFLPTFPGVIPRRYFSAAFFAVALTAWTQVAATLSTSALSVATLIAAALPQQSFFWIKAFWVDIFRIDPFAATRGGTHHGGSLR